MDQYIGTPLEVRSDKDAGTFQVSRRVFTEQNILDLENEKIFQRCWLYFGHDSELPEPASFLTRTVAGRDFIFNREYVCKIAVIDLPP